MPGETIGFQLIVGLGNPGREYEETRHNAGFWFIDQIAARAGVSLKPETRFFGQVAKARVGGQMVYLLKPTEFMNLSGKSIAPLVRFYKLDPSKMLVVHDELDLEPGIIRLKKGGGAGGHNGLRDTIARLGVKDFWRLRVGVGHPGHKSAVSGYVLKRAPSDQQRLMDEALELAASNIDRIVAGDINEATKTLHSHKPPANG